MLGSFICHSVIFHGLQLGSGLVILFLRGNCVVVFFLFFLWGGGGGGGGGECMPQVCIHFQMHWANYLCQLSASCKFAHQLNGDVMTVCLKAPH